MSAELETDPARVSLIGASLIELSILPEREARIQIVVPAMSKQYIPVAAWINVRFHTLAGWKINIRPNVWPDLISEIETSSAIGSEWKEVIDLWARRNGDKRVDFTLYILRTDAGSLEFMSESVTKEIVDVILRVIP